MVLDPKTLYTLTLDTDRIRALDRPDALKALEEVRDELNARITGERARIVADEVAEQKAYHKPGAQARAAKALKLSTQRISQMMKETPMATTTDYGTWNNHGDSSALTVEATVAGYISGADSEWIDRIQADGSFDDMVAAYRSAINAALPDGVTLAGNDFYGPVYDADKDFDGYPTDEDGALDIAAIIADIDLAAIVDEHDPDNE